MNATSDLNVTPIFSSFLCEGQLNIDHDRVLHWIRSQESDVNGRIRLGLAEPELTEYYAEVRAIFNDLHTQLGLKRQYYQDLKKGWVNTDWNVRFGVAHRHIEATFNSIYYPYVEGDEVGHLELVNPNTSLPYVISSEANENSVVDRFNIYNANLWRVIPRSWLIVVIPSWVEHFATPNGKESNIRYSIALDSIIKHSAKK